MRNTRFITAIIAFAATFAVSVGLVWMLFGFPVTPTSNYSHHNCSKRYAAAIYSHIQRDVTNGVERDRRSFQTNNWSEDGEIGYSIENHSNSVTQYVEESKSLDVSDLPSEFQAAWQKHLNAWSDYAEFLNDVKTSSAGRKISERSFAASDNRYTAEINETWSEVLRIAENYGI